MWHVSQDPKDEKELGMRKSEREKHSGSRNRKCKGFEMGKSLVKLHSIVSNILLQLLVNFSCSVMEPGLQTYITNKPLSDLVSC